MRWADPGHGPQDLAGAEIAAVLGYLRHERGGRRTRHTLCLDGTARHRAEAHMSVRDRVEAFTPHDSRH
ncbi:hypothetical protein [Streptomyces flaveolus]|uniref:hypothetical protein n=1 Tax=Streptomyces flaveolus TaxID=67297 RepID=UPI0033244379